MASFVEKAVLEVVDRSSKKLKTINKNLAAVQRTARGMRNMRVEVRGLTKANSDTVKLADTLRRVPKSKNVSVKLTTTGATSLRKTVADLSRDRMLKLTVTTPGATASINKLEQLRTLTRQLNAVRVSVPVTMPAAAVAPTTGPRVAATPASRRTVGPSPSMFGVPIGNLTNTPFPGNLPAAFNITTAYMTVRAAEMTVRTAVQATVEAQTEQTARETVFNPMQQARIAEVGLSAAAASTHITIARGEKIARDLYTTGFRGETLDAIAPHIAQLEAAALAVAPDKAQSITTLANKLGNLAAVTEDPDRALAITQAAFQAAVLQGETFNASTFLSALRVSGKAQTLSPEGLLRMALATDEMGRRIGSGLARLDKLLSIDIKDAGAGGGVAKGTVERLIDAQVRGEGGLTLEERQQFDADPLKFISDFVTKVAATQGLDPVKTEDRAAVKQLLVDLGFVSAEARAILNEVSARAEREKAIPIGLAVDPARVNEAGADDLAFQLRNLAAQFKSFSSQVLEPIFETIAPVVKNVADGFQELATAEGPTAQLKRLAAVATTAATGVGLFAGAMALRRKLSPMDGAATKLIASSANLDAAAAKMMGVTPGVPGAAGVPGGKPGVVGGPGAMSKFLLTANTVSIAAQVATMDTGQEARERRRESLNESVTSLAEWLGFGGFAERQNQRNEDLEQRAREGDVSMFMRALRNMSEPLPAADPVMVEARLQAEQDNEIRAKIERLTGVMERNEARIVEPGRSDASVQSLLVQNESISETIDGLRDMLVVPTEIELAFNVGADRMIEGADAINEASLSFGPMAGQSLLDIAPEFGQAVGQSAGQAFRATVGDLGVDVNVNGDGGGTEPALSTGEQVPF